MGAKQINRDPLLLSAINAQSKADFAPPVITSASGLAFQRRKRLEAKTSLQSNSPLLELSRGSNPSAGS